MLQLIVWFAVTVSAGTSPSAAPRTPRVPQVPAPLVSEASTSPDLCPYEGTPRVDRAPLVPRPDESLPEPAVGMPVGRPGIRQMAQPLPAELQTLVDRIEADPGSPEWKRTIADRIRSRRIGRFNALLTVYCTDSSADPTGGGPHAAWGGIPLRWGHAASDWRHIPKGTVLYLPSPVDTILVVVDNGPGVKGAGRLDICTTDPGQYFDLASRVNVGRAVPCWRIGRKTTSKEAR